MNSSRKETVKRAVHFQNPAYITLRYTASDDKADVIIVPVEHHFMGPGKDESRLLTYTIGTILKIILP